LSKSELRGLSRRQFIPTLADLRNIKKTVWVKSPFIGVGAGILPGAGAAMAALLSYGEAKRTSENKDEYGEGSLEGLVSAESGNNAMCPGAIIPLLTFGIPGDAVTALMLGVLLIHGLVPGPGLVAEQGAVVGPMLASFAITPLLILISIFILGTFYARMISLNKAFLYAFISMIAIVGVYAATFSTFQLTMVVIVGIIAYLLAREGYPQIPFLMGFILGPFFENYLRTALLVNQNSITMFVTRPLSLLFLLLSIVFAYVLGYKMKQDV